MLEASAEAGEAIQASLADINGKRGEPRSFDRLERLLESEAYRLSFWRVAMDEINYRRFFDINDLAAIRVEDPEVFSAGPRADLRSGAPRPHPRTARRSSRRPVRAGEIFPLSCRTPARPGAPARTEHAKPNGANRTFYIVAEKILTGNEPLRTEWAVEGTTGYGFLNLVNGLFVDHTKEKAFQQLYRRFTGWTTAFDDLVCDSKRLILQVAMSSELNVLARKLDRHFRAASLVARFHAGKLARCACAKCWRRFRSIAPTFAAIKLK